jgi:outer membrane lipoprotein
MVCCFDQPKFWSAFVLIVVAVSLASCAPKISKRLQEQANTSVSFAEVLREPDAYHGQVMILGGYILQTEIDPGGSVITVLQAPLGFRLEPKSRDLSQGRFLVKTAEFLDPELYDKGRKVTAAGKLTGVETKPLDNDVYAYPVIATEELYLWPKLKPYPIPYDPYWYDPWSPYYPYYPSWPYRRR